MQVERQSGGGGVGRGGGALPPSVAGDEKCCRIIEEPAGKMRFRGFTNIRNRGSSMIISWTEGKWQRVQCK